MRSTTAAVDPTLLGSATSFSAGRELKLPVKNLPAIKFVGKRRTVACAAASSLPPLWLVLPLPSLASATDENSLLQEEIRKVLSKGKAAGLLRLVFHDAGTFDKGDKTGDMNGSIVYEPDRPENMGLLKSLKILEKVKGQVDATTSILGRSDSRGWSRGCFSMWRSQDPCSAGKNRCNSLGTCCIIWSSYSRKQRFWKSNGL